MFLLDTDILSNLRKSRPHPDLLRWVADTGWAELATTSITVMEIQIGIERARRSDLAAANRVDTWLSGLLASGDPKIEPLDASAARLLGQMRETPALRHFTTQDPRARVAKTGADLAIAAIAIARSAVIATNNIADFLAINRHFPIPGLLNPTTGAWAIPRPA